MFQQPQFEYFIECEICFCRIDICVDKFRDLRPMAFLHAVLPQRDHQRQLRPELLHVILHSLTDHSNVRHRLVLEVLIRVNDIPETFLNKLLCCIGVNCLELVVHPHLDVSVPTVDDRPQRVVRCELF